MKLFVFTPSQTGPQPQMWSERPVDGNGKEKVKPLFTHVLTELEEYDWDIGRLTLDHFTEKFKNEIIPRLD